MPEAARRAPQEQSKAWWLRTPVATACVLGSGSAVYWMPQLRAAEATSAARAVGAITHGATSVDPARATFYWDLGRPEVHGLTVTSQCSVVPFAAVLLLVSAALVPSARMGWVRVVVGCLVATAIAIAVNNLRLTGIAWAIHVFGPRVGLWWSHTVLGSLASVGGVLAALAAFSLLAFGGSPSPSVSPNQKARCP